MPFTVLLNEYRTLSDAFCCVFQPNVTGRFSSVTGHFRIIVTGDFRLIVTGFMAKF